MFGFLSFVAVFRAVVTPTRGRAEGSLNGAKLSAPPPGLRRSAKASSEGGNADTAADDGGQTRRGCERPEPAVHSTNPESRTAAADSNFGLDEAGSTSPTPAPPGLYL